MPAIPTNDPVSTILLTAGRLGVRLQPSDLPETAYRLYRGVLDGLRPRRLPEEQRRFIALDAAIALCGDLAGTRLQPYSLDLAFDTIARCLTAHNCSADWAPLCLGNLRLWCVGGLEVPSLKCLERRLRDERIRRDYWDVLNYAAVARRYRLHPRHVRRIIADANGPSRGTAGRKQEQTEAVK